MKVTLKKNKTKEQCTDMYICKLQNNWSYFVDLKLVFLYSFLVGEELWSEADSSCSGQPIHLWQFLRELLLKPHNYGRCIRWLNKEKGILI